MMPTQSEEEWHLLGLLSRRLRRATPSRWRRHDRHTQSAHGFRATRRRRQWAPLWRGSVIRIDRLVVRRRDDSGTAVRCRCGSRWPRGWGVWGRPCRGRACPLMGSPTVLCSPAAPVNRRNYREPVCTQKTAHRWALAWELGHRARVPLIRRGGGTRRSTVNAKWCVWLRPCRVRGGRWMRPRPERYLSTLGHGRFLWGCRDRGVRWTRARSERRQSAHGVPPDPSRSNTRISSGSCTPSRVRRGGRETRLRGQSLLTARHVCAAHRLDLITRHGGQRGERKGLRCPQRGVWKPQKVDGARRTREGGWERTEARKKTKATERAAPRPWPHNEACVTTRFGLVEQLACGYFFCTWRSAPGTDTSDATAHSMCDIWKERPAVGGRELVLGVRLWPVRRDRGCVTVTRPHGLSACFWVGSDPLNGMAGDAIGKRSARSVCRVLRIFFEWWWSKSGQSLVTCCVRSWVRAF